jgi:PAS domain S-box-containing protein
MAALQKPNTGGPQPSRPDEEQRRKGTALTASRNSRCVDQAGTANQDPDDAGLDALRFKIASLEELLAVQEQAVRQGSQQLEETLHELRGERRRLRHSEERLRSILDAALDAAVCFDVNAVVIDWNPQAELALGWSREQALGKTAESLRFPLPFGDGAANSRPSAGRWAEGLLLDQRVERTAMHRDGWKVPVELGVSRIGSGDDTVYSVFLRNITDRKEGEEHLAEARDGALTASRLKSEFLATMSHEVRTPMNGVVGMAELLLSTTLSAEQREYALAIQGSAETLLAILNDILDFSKIEVDRLLIESIPFDLRRVAEETTELLAPKAAEKRLELMLRYAPKAPAGLVGDPVRLRQVLNNLIGNAIKFTPTGQVWVNVECEQSTKTTAQIRLVVEDTGIGIAADKLQHIFEKFTQADSSTTRQYGGTGLGLAITKRLVELMGGTVGVESTLRKGSRFVVRLTLPRDARVATTATPAQSLKGLRVLVADDNEINRRIVYEQLTRHRVTAKTVAGGGEALAALRQAHASGAAFDIALLDYDMPDMTGEEVARRIKADPTLAATALVLFTSVVGQGAASRTPRAGFADILVKPVRAIQLLRSLARARAQRYDASPGRRQQAAAAPSGAGSPPSTEQRCRARVLVAEDSIVNQKVVSRMLQKLGCTVDLAVDGRQAVSLATAGSYDVIFMDCQMPEMDGYEATAVIRRNPSTSQTPIIALTANAMQGDRERCLQAGMNDYLAKPVKMADLTDRLERWAPAPAGNSR